MNGRYESIIYSKDDQAILDGTVLTSNEIEYINNLKIKLKDKSYSLVIEDFFKFSKNSYSTSDLSEIFKVSVRQIQNIFKELGLNRDRYEAQNIAAIKRNSEKLKSTFKRTIIDGLTASKLSGSSLDQYIRYILDLFLTESLPNSEVIVGISSMNVNDTASDIPIIIINSNYLYKYIIEINNAPKTKSASSKKREKMKKSKAFYKGYTLLGLDIKSYSEINDTLETRFEKEVKESVSETVNYIILDVTNSTSIIKLE